MPGAPTSRPTSFALPRLDLACGYLSEGMDESEFVEAGVCLTDLIHAYQAHERPQHTTTASSTSLSS